MFLYPDEKKNKAMEALQQIVIDQILYILWDLGWKVGHATRTVKEAMKEAKGDIQTKNALLESRFICGSQALAESFQQAYRSFCRKDAPQKYIESRLRDQEARRQRYGNTVFIQEPDIKNGVGGLRDLQNLLWMAQIKLDASSWSELHNKHYLSKNEQEQIERCYDFLLYIRNELHFLRKRPTDVLDLDAQLEIAEHLGHAQKNVFSSVEAFMRNYYHHTITVLRLCRILEKRLALLPSSRLNKISQQAAQVVTRKLRKRIIQDGFVFDGQEITAQHPDIFQDDPRRLVRIFLYLQMWNARLGFELEARIRETLTHTSPEELQTPDCQRTVLTIMQFPGQVYPALYAMYDTGVLKHFMPEFGRLDCLVQHEYYHRYTADFHTLSTIRELDRIFQDESPQRHVYLEQIRQVAAPWLLYPILLLHDIGKGWGIKGHAEKGVEIAEPILKKMGLNSEQVEISLFQIKHHLTMARFWQKHDIDDPDTIASFSSIIQNTENLRMLFVLTYCDANGTSSDLWNDYKNVLHCHLFENTLADLEREETPVQAQRERKSTSYQNLLTNTNLDLHHEEIQAHYNLLPESYFYQTNEEEIALHIQLVHRLLETLMLADALDSLRPVIHWQNDLSRGYTLVHVVTWDREGLFSRLAGAFSVAGLNILSVRAFARQDNITIDTFTVMPPEGGMVETPKIPALFEETLNQCLIESFDMLPLIVAQGKKYQKAFKRMDRLRASIVAKIRVYEDTALNKTIVEVQANDQIGLLYQITKIITEHHFDITYARISTERGMAIDTFYIRPGDLFDDEDISDALQSLHDELSEKIHLLQTAIAR